MIVVVAVLIVGLLAAVILGRAHSAPTVVKRAIPAEAVAACITDFNTLAAVAQNYLTNNAVEPPPGTGWATSRSHGGPYVTSWPNESGLFRVSWNGAQLVVIPARGPTSTGNVGTARPRTGCYAA